MNTWSFACSACGKCCNSPPRLSLPELLRHRERFIGALAIRQVSRPRVGATVDAGPHRHAFTPADVQAHARLAAELLLQPAGADSDLAILTVGFDYPSVGRCPALAEGGGCLLHDSGKPAECAAVPLDALLPDRLQPLVLADRAAADGGFGADCIAAGTRDGFPIVTRQQQVVEPALAAALARRRSDLAADKERWGNRVFAMAERDLLAPGATGPRVPTTGYFTLSLVPVLMVLAAESPAAHRDTQDFIAAQLTLIEHAVQAALLRKLPADRPTTRQLRAWADAYRALSHALAVRPADEWGQGGGALGNAGECRAAAASSSG